MADPRDDRQRLEELLAFYVNGRLGADDRQWVADYLAAHPDAAALLQVEERLRAVVRATASARPEAVRLDRLLSEFRSAQPRRSPWARLAQWFAQAHPIPAPAIAATIVLLLAQGIVLVQTLPERGIESERYRGLAAPCEDGPRIRVVFRPEAPQAEVVMLLRKVEATVSAGPTETGELWLRIPPGRPLAEALGQLKASRLVDEAIVAAPDRRGCPQ